MNAKVHTSGDENGQKEEVEEKFSDDGISGPLLYPIDEGSQYSSRVVFVIGEIVPPQVSGNTSAGDALKQVSSSIVQRGKEASSSDDNNNGILGFLSGIVEDFTSIINDSGVKIVKGSDGKDITREKETGFDPNTRKLTGKSISIYLPVGFASTDTLNYESPQLGVLGASVQSAINSGSGLASSTKKGLLDLKNSFSTAEGGDLASLGMTKLASKGPAEISLGASAALRVTADPNIRTLFKGVGVRQFQFQFKFIAKSKQEAVMVENIIKRFRYYSYPESITLGESIGAGFKFPNPFNIAIESTDETGKMITVGHRILGSYLTTINTNYNASSMSFHSDGRPVEIDLSLTFTEETTLNRTKIKDGF